MDGHSSCWHDLSLMPTTTAPCDQSATHLPAHSPAQSCSDDVRLWQNVASTMHDVVNSNNINSADLGVFCGGQPAMLLPCPATQNRKDLGAQPPELAPLTTVDDESSVPDFARCGGTYQMWTPTSEPMPLHSPNVPGNSAWGASPFADNLTFDNFSASGSAFDATHSHHQPTRQFVAETNPMLSQGLSINGDLLDDGWDSGETQPFYPDNMASGDELDDSDPCYAQLLFRCLKEAPDHTMSLRELYDWVAHHSSKARDAQNRGWQNSVRHNLSMNAAFERVTQLQGVKKTSSWRLTEQALREGVISTTRYRKDPKHRLKLKSRTSPALKRQISGAKGGQATRAANRRQQAQQALRQARSYPNIPDTERERYFNGGRRSGFYTPAPVDSARPSPPPSQALLQFHQQPASPYFFNVDENVTALPIQSPLTPPQLPLIYQHPVKPAFGTLDFGIGGDYTSGAFNETSDSDMATEGSFMTDNGWHMVMSESGVQEATTFI